MAFSHLAASLDYPSANLVPRFYCARRSKAWDPFTCDRCQMTLDWAKCTAAPTYLALEVLLTIATRETTLVYY